MGLLGQLGQGATKGETKMLHPTSGTTQQKVYIYVNESLNQNVITFQNFGNSWIMPDNTVYDLVASYIITPNECIVLDTGNTIHHTYDCNVEDIIKNNTSK